MFFYLAKIVWFLVQPSTLMLLMLIVGLVMLWTRYARTGRRLVALAVVLLTIAGLSPLGHAIMLPLENRFPSADLSSGKAPDGIILLGGAQDMLVSAARGRPSLTEAGERFLEAAMLAKRFPQAKLLISGGSGGIIYNRQSEADAAAEIFADLGIAETRILRDSRSRDTYENARYSKEVADPKPGERWLLVTSANHMARAMGCFRTVGFAVEPWPVDYRTRGRDDLGKFFYRPSSGLRRVDIATRQWAGLIAYRLTGRIDSFFPAP